MSGDVCLDAAVDQVLQALILDVFLNLMGQKDSRKTRVLFSDFLARCINDFWWTLQVSEAARHVATNGSKQFVVLSAVVLLHLDKRLHHGWVDTSALTSCHHR